MLRLRPTGAGDLAQLMDMEADPDTGHWLGETGSAWHEQVLADPDQEHLSAWVDGELSGFVVLAGLCRGDRSVELRRMVIARGFRGTGRGRALLAAALGKPANGTGPGASGWM